MCVAEGIETGLAVQQVTGIPTVAALSKSGTVRLDLPSVVQEVIICADGDDAGREAAKFAACHFRNNVRIIRVAPADDGQDFADMLNE